MTETLQTVRNNIMAISSQFKIVRIKESAASFETHPLITSPEEIEKFWQTYIATSDIFEENKEFLIVIPVNTKLRAIGWNVVSIGSVNESIAHPREILRPVILSGAYGFALIHNHPSGSVDPSNADRASTCQIKKAAELFQIRFLDHVIIGDANMNESRRSFYSFRECGLI